MDSPAKTSDAFRIRDWLPVHRLSAICGIMSAGPVQYTTYHISFSTELHAPDRNLTVASGAQF